jgi:hypothetical protein
MTRIKEAKKTKANEEELEVEKEEEAKPEEKVEEKEFKEDEEEEKPKEEEVEKEEELTEEEVKEACSDYKKKKKAMSKGEEINPEESESNATDANATITPGAVIQTGQNVFVPNSGVSGDRMAVGNSSSPSSISYAGKSINPVLMKSPLYKELSKQLDDMNKNVSIRLAAVEKSVNARVANVMKAMEKVDEFYKKPFYKAVSDQASPEGVQKLGIKEQIEKGEVRYSN